MLNGEPNAGKQLIQLFNNVKIKENNILNAEQNAEKQLVQLVILIQLVHEIRIQTNQNLQNNVKIRKMLVQLIHNVKIKNKNILMLNAEQKAENNSPNLSSKSESKQLYKTMWKLGICLKTTEWWTKCRKTTCPTRPQCQNQKE